RQQGDYFPSLAERAELLSAANIGQVGAWSEDGEHNIRGVDSLLDFNRPTGASADADFVQPDEGAVGFEVALQPLRQLGAVLASVRDEYADPLFHGLARCRRSVASVAGQSRA